MIHPSGKARNRRPGWKQPRNRWGCGRSCCGIRWDLVSTLMHDPVGNARKLTAQLQRSRQNPAHYTDPRPQLQSAGELGTDNPFSNPRNERVVMLPHSGLEPSFAEVL